MVIQLVYCIVKFVSLLLYIYNGGAAPKNTEMNATV